MKEINPRKAHGSDLVARKVSQEASAKCFKALTKIFDAIIRTKHFPNQMKVAQVVIIPKSIKQPVEVSSDRPIACLLRCLKSLKNCFLNT